MKSYKSIDEYISIFPADVQNKLKIIRQIVSKTVPEAEEKISYGMPTFYLNGNLVHFAGYKDYIGFYPAPSGINAFKKESLKYKTGKGTLQFSLIEELPVGLIEKIVQFRVKENLNKV